jgi:hypothetical protein
VAADSLGIGISNNEDTDMQLSGTVKMITAKYGFVRSDSSGNAPVRDFYLASREFAGVWEELRIGDKVRFTYGESSNRQPRAFDASILTGSEK